MHTDKYGLLINAAVSLAIAVVAIIVGIIILRRQRGSRVRGAGYVFALYWLALALLYFFVALRTVAGYLGYEHLDLVFFYVDNVFGGLMPPCAAFLFIYFVTGGKTRFALIPAVLILGVWVVWNIVNVSAGAGNYQITFWFTEWEPNSTLARTLSIFGLYIPGVISMLGMNFALIRAQSRLARYRIILTSISMIVAISVIIIDYLAPGPPWIRLIILLAVLLGLFAYIPPKFLHRWLEIEEVA
jgi:hypothetical protein